MSNNDLISRSELKKTLCEEFEAREHYIGEIMLKAIDNAPTVETKQDELANEVWQLYEKHQPYLATRVIEFGDELKELLGKYQKGGNNAN